MLEQAVIAGPGARGADPNNPSDKDTLKLFLDIFAEEDDSMSLLETPLSSDLVDKVWAQVEEEIGTEDQEKVFEVAAMRIKHLEEVAK